MQWTTDKPTIIGWYWIWDKKYKSDPYIGRVIEYENKLLVFSGGGTWELNDFTYWIGPLEQPEPPTDEPT